MPYAWISGGSADVEDQPTYEGLLSLAMRGLGPALEINYVQYSEVQPIIAEAK